MGILTTEIKEFIKLVKLGFMATVCPDRTPNLSPKGTTIVWDDDHLVFADIHSPGTVNNLLINPAIEISMVDVFTRKGYRFKGVAEVFASGSIFEAVMAAYKEAGLKHTVKNIVMVEVQRVLPVVSPAYDNDTTEEEVITRWRTYWDGIYGGNKEDKK